MIRTNAQRLVEDPIPSEVSVRTVSLEDRERLARDGAYLVRAPLRASPREAAGERVA